MTPTRLGEVRQQSSERIGRLELEYREVQGKISKLRGQDERVRAVVLQPQDGQFAPVRQSSLDEPMLVSQIVRIVPANSLSGSQKLGVYFSRWWEFLSDHPREANTE